MSKDTKNRSLNQSPLPKPSFSSFLEPSPRPSPSPLQTFSTRTESPINKSNKSCRVSPITNTLASKLELTEKQVVMLQERNKVLSKEKQNLQKKLSKDKPSANKTFKEHAVALTKYTYSKLSQKPSETYQNIQEKVGNIKKLVSWICEQPQNTELKFIRRALEDVQENFRGFEVEFEAKLAFIEESHQSQVKKLEKIIQELETRQMQETQETLTVLLKKNNELVKQTCAVSQQNEDFKVKAIQRTIAELQQEIEMLQRPEVQTELQQKVIEEYKVQVYLGKKQEDQEIASSLLELESRYLDLKSYCTSLEQEVQSKLIKIENCYKEIAELKLLAIKSRVKEENRVVRSNSGDRVFRNRPKLPVYPAESSIDLLPFTCCLAAALEDFLY